MSETLRESRRDQFRTAIRTFLQDRLATKLEKLAEDDPKRDELKAQFTLAVWLEDAARRVRQIQAVTHSLKPIHPDARGTNLYVEPDQLEDHAEIGSHILGNRFSGDVVGNAAALDVYKLLKLPIENRSLLDWLMAEDVDAIAALSDTPVEAKAWCAAFTGITQPSDPVAASHPRAKQLYWLVGEDPCEDADYQLLAPLYASSLAHAVFETINEDRFGERNKLANAAHKAKRDHDGSYRSYPDLAVQKLGGTKPQNISQLNSERGGNNYLLGSLPPVWKVQGIRSPLNVESVFESRYGVQPEVRQTVRALRRFLETDPPSNTETRAQVDAFTDTLVDLLVIFSAEIQQGVEPGWSAEPPCHLVQAERLWLDPGRARDDPDFRGEWLWMDWPDDIGRRFARWLNQQLKGKLPVGDVEQRHWQRELLLDEDQNGWAQQLQALRTALDAPHDIPTRKAVTP